MVRYRAIFIGVLVIVLAFWLAQYAKDNESIRQVVSQYGYFGIFGIAIISGFNLAVPIPAISFLPLFLESGLGTWSTILVVSLGVTLADMIAFFLGKAGRHVFPEGKIIKRIQKLGEKNVHSPILVLFLFASFVPLPNEVLGLPMGFMGYNKWHVLTAVFLGNFVFNTLYGLGVVNIFNLL